MDFEKTASFVLSHEKGYVGTNKGVYRYTTLQEYVVDYLFL